MAEKVKEKKNTEERLSGYMETALSRIERMAKVGSEAETLAAIRKGIGKAPGEVPDCDAAIIELMRAYFVKRLPGGVPSWEQWACHIAATSYAWHQQGHNVITAPMHSDDGTSLGSALGELSKCYADGNAEKRAYNYLRRVIMANDIKGVSVHMRSIIKMLSANNIPMDYTVLIRDLYKLQIPQTKAGVCLKWTGDFFSVSYYQRVDNEEE